MASFYERRGKLDEALAALESQGTTPEYLALQQQRLRVLLRGGGRDDLTRAKRILTELEKRFGERPQLLFLRAKLLQTEQDTRMKGEMQKLLQRVVDLEPGHVKAYLMLVEFAIERKDPARARELAAQALKAKHLAGQPDQAAALAHKVLGFSPADADAISLLGRLAVESKAPARIADALALARQAVSERPEDDRLTLTVFRILADTGRHEAGIKELQAYVESTPGQRSTGG